MSTNDGSNPTGERACTRAICVPPNEQDEFGCVAFRVFASDFELPNEERGSKERLAILERDVFLLNWHSSGNFCQIVGLARVAVVGIGGNGTILLLSQSRKVQVDAL